MQFSDFRYMVWAKEHGTAPRFHLGRSGLAPPDPELLALADSLPDLACPGADMPEEARQRVAVRSGVTKDAVMLTLGTSHALYLACATLLEPGDTVWVESPSYEVLRTLPELLGARVAPVERRWDAGYRLPGDLPDRIRAVQPRLVVLSNPHNPTATLLGPAELEPIARALAAVGGQLLVDEVYLEFCGDPQTSSVATLGENVLVASSLTKAYGLGAVRFGWLIGAPARVARCVRFNDYVGVLYPSPSAWVGLRALDRIGLLRERAAELRRSQLPRVERFVSSRSDVSWRAPHATTMCWLRLERVRDTVVFAERLLARFDTLVVPGEFFGAPGFVRVGFGVDQDILDEGLSRLGQALDEASS